MLRARLRLIRWLIVQAVPVLNQFRKPTGWSVTVSELNRLRPDSWGRALAQFLSVRNLGFLPQYEAHDALHCLLGYGTTATGELRLQAFMMGNRSITVAGRVLLLIGLCLVPELRSRLRHEFQRGRASARVASWSIVALLGEPIELIRRGIGEPAV